MTVGQVAAGSAAVELNAAFAPAPGRLVSNPKSELGFVEPARANGKPFSFHFRAKSDGASVNEGPRERESSRRGVAYGTGQDEESPEVPPPGEDTALTAAPLDSTALDTARGIIAELQALPRVPRDAVKTTADGHASAGNRSADPLAPFGNLEQPGDFSQASAFQKVASLLPAPMPGATIEHAELALPDYDSNSTPPSRIVEQGLGRTFFGRGASDPSPDLAASTSPRPETPESQPNPVENLRAIAATEAAVRVKARALTTRSSNVANAGGAQGLLPSPVVTFGSGRTTQHHHEPNHASRNQPSAKKVGSIDHTMVTASLTPHPLTNVSHEGKSIIDSLNFTYPLSQALPFNKPSEGVFDTKTLFEQSPERKAEQSNIPSTRPKPDSRLAHFRVPMGPQGNASEKAASLAVSAAHFSLRPTETRGDEGIAAGSLSHRFSTSIPQTAAAHLPTGAELKAADAAASRAPSSGGVSRAEPVLPAQHAAPEVARHNEGRTSSPMAPKAAASEFTRTDANLVSSSHSAAAPAADTRRERGYQDRPSGTESSRTQKGLGSPEQPESQPAHPGSPFAKRSASASGENELGRSFRGSHSDSEKSNLSNRILVPAVKRPASDTADPASQTLPRPAESSPRAPSVISRPSDLSNQAQASYSERVRAVEHVVELASLQKNSHLNQMNVVLRDSQLGRISLRLVERNGVIDTLLRTDNARTGQLIGESLPQMLESLSQKGFDVSHSGSEQWTGSQQDQRQGGRQRPPRPAARQGRRGPGAERVFRLEIDS